MKQKCIFIWVIWKELNQIIYTDVSVLHLLCPALNPTANRLQPQNNKTQA